MSQFIITAHFTVGCGTSSPAQMNIKYPCRTEDTKEQNHSNMVYILYTNKLGIKTMTQELRGKINLREIDG
jgi:hypothetical protein